MSLPPIPEREEERLARFGHQLRGERHRGEEIVFRVTDLIKCDLLESISLQKKCYKVTVYQTQKFQIKYYLLLSINYLFPKQTNLTIRDEKKSVKKTTCKTKNVHKRIEPMYTQSITHGPEFQVPFFTAVIQL